MKMEIPSISKRGYKLREQDITGLIQDIVQL
uniref:Uncharacterized protein n=1 Tax=Arundo donax TaxID=35708 RepID=A0A0A9GX32_ARUDO